MWPFVHALFGLFLFLLWKYSFWKGELLVSTSRTDIYNTDIPQREWVGVNVPIHSGIGLEIGS